MAKEIGRIGQNRYGTTGSGHIFYEEFLTSLQGIKGVQAYSEMADNDATVGAILYAIEMLMRQCEFHIEPAGNTKKDEECAEFVESCMHDMERTWTDTLSEFLSFLTYGWSYHEIVYKRRVGSTDSPITNSKHNDGLIGWRKLPIRSQDSFFSWEYKEGTDDLTGMTQMPPPTFERITIPIEKALHFRTRSRKDNPEGRALALDTPIPTPDGWKTIRELKVGDKVFDERGRVCYVVAEQEWENRPCYRVKFNDGTCIIADANHQWLVCNQYERNRGKIGKIRTTEEIAQSVKTKSGVSNYSIDVAGPLDYSAQGLTLDPYYLGQWLGDGNSLNSNITTHVDDAEETLRLIGYDGIVVNNGKSGGMGRLIKLKNKGIMGAPIEQLRALGLINNKHIPEHYLRGNKEQRLALLQGLMDSDGTVDRLHRCTFTNTNKNLADGVYELVTSLGCVAMRSQKLPDGDKRKQVSYQVKFTPVSFNPFRLERKRARVKDDKARNAHYIVSCEMVEARNTKCIEVDSASHMYLAGPSMVPTHNSILRTAYRAYYFKKRIEEIEGYGIERDLAGFPVLYAPPDMEIWSDDPDMRKALANAEMLVSSVRRDAREGLVLPGGENGWKFELVTSGSRRQFDTNAIIDRYDKRIATSVLADFVMLGQQQVGSFALADSKTKIFALAVGTYLDVICEVFNNQAIPRLVNLNGDHFKGITDYPKMVHSDIEEVDLDQFTNALTGLVGNGILVPDEGIEDEVRRILHLPERIDTGDPAQQPGQDPLDQNGIDETESKSIYKVTSIIEKYQKGTVTRNAAARLLQTIGLDEESINFYLTEADAGRKAAQKEEKRTESGVEKNMGETLPTGEEEDAIAAERAKKRLWRK